MGIYFRMFVGALLSAIFEKRRNRMTSEDISNLQIYFSIAFFLLPLGELIFKKSDGNLFKRITPVGFACFFIAIVFGVLSKAGLIALHKEQKAEKHISDSIRKSDKREIINGFGDAIGKYGLGYDSAKQEIVKLSKLIKDSKNRKTIIIEGENPVVGFYEEGLKLVYVRNDTLKFNIRVASRGAGSTINYLKYYIMTSSNSIDGIFKDIKFIHKGFINTRNMNVAKDEYIEGGGSVRGVSVSKLKYIIVFITGNYTDLHGSNPQKINDVGILNIISNEFSILGTPSDDKVMSFLKDKNLL